MDDDYCDGEIIDGSWHDCCCQWCHHDALDAEIEAEYQSGRITHAEALALHAHL